MEALVCGQLHWFWYFLRMDTLDVLNGTDKYTVSTLYISGVYCIMGLFGLSYFLQFISLDCVWFHVFVSFVFWKGIYLQWFLVNMKTYFYSEGFLSAHLLSLNKLYLSYKRWYIFRCKMTWNKCQGMFFFSLSERTEADSQVCFICSQDIHFYLYLGLWTAHDVFLYSGAT